MVLYTVTVIIYSYIELTTVFLLLICMVLQAMMSA